MTHSDLPLYRMAAAMAAAVLGVTLMKIALPTLAGLNGLSVMEIGLITGSIAVAWPAFALIAGWGLDRFGRASVFRLGLILAGLAAVGFALKFSAGVPAVLFLCGLALVVGIGEVSVETAGQTILPDLVTKAELPRANGLMQGGKTVAATLAAPVLLASVLGFEAGLTFGTAFALLLLALVLLPRPVRRFRARRVRIQGFFEGARLLAREVPHRRFTLLLTAMTISWGAWMTLIVPYTLSPDHLGLGAEGVGQVMTALGLGSLAGAFGFRRIIGWLGRRGTLAVDPVVSTLFLVIPGIGLGVAPVFASAFLAGIGGVTWTVAVAAYQQASVPAAVLGRAVSAYRWIGWSGFFIGAGLSGVVADGFGLQSAFLVFALPAVAATLYFWSIGADPSLSGMPEGDAV